jgi:amino acid permease
MLTVVSCARVATFSLTSSIKSPQSLIKQGACTNKEYMTGPKFLQAGSASGAALSFAVATVGAGILALPSAFADAGVITSVVVMVVVAFYTVASIRYLAICIETLRLYSYESISRELLGPTFEVIARWMLIVYNFGVAVGYVVAMGELLEPFYPWIASTFPLLQSRESIMIAFWAVVMLPLSFVRHITALNKISLLAVIAIHYIAIAVIYRYFVPWEGTSGTTYTAAAVLGNHSNVHAPYGRHVTRAPLHTTSGGIVATVSGVSGVLEIHLASWNFVAMLAMPIMLFSFDCQSLVFQIYHSLAEPSVPTMTWVATLSTTMCFCVYAAAGLFGYLSHGQYIRDNILNNYNPNKDPVFAVAYALYVIPVNLAFALVLFPVRDAIFNYAFHTTGGDDEESHVSEFNYNLTSLCLSVLAIVLALVTPGLVSIFSLLGALCGSTLCFIYPASYRLRLHYLRVIKPRKWYSEAVMWSMIAVGVFGATFGTAVSVYKLFGGN